MRADPHQKAEVISQALFSEEILLLEEQAEWAKICTLVDHYQGWIKKEGICCRDEVYPSLGNESKFVTVKRCTAHLYDHQDTIYGPILTLPYESRLELHKEMDHRWLQVMTPGKQCAYVQRGDVEVRGLDSSILNMQQMCEFSQFFLGLPYTWGGRSSFGYDCSGFVQMLYRRCGLFLPRDSKDQCCWSEFSEVSLDSLKEGDLIFFGHDKDKIRHVGMYLTEDRFIHTAAVVENAPYIRISHLTDSAWNGSGYYSYRTARHFERG